MKYFAAIIFLLVFKPLLAQTDFSLQAFGEPTFVETIIVNQFGKNLDYGPIVTVNEGLRFNIKRKKLQFSIAYEFMTQGLNSKIQNVSFDGSDNEVFSNKQRIYSHVFPLSAKYIFLENKRTSLLGGLDLLPGWFSIASFELKSASSGTIKGSSEVNTPYYGIGLGIELQQMIGRKLFLGFGMKTNYELGDLFGNRNYLYHYLNNSLEVGIGYYFRKSDQ